MKGNHKIQNGIDEPRYLLGVVRHLSPMRLNGEDANRITYEGFTDEVLKIVQVELLPCIETYTGNDLRNIL